MAGVTGGHGVGGMLTGTAPDPPARRGVLSVLAGVFDESGALRPGADLARADKEASRALRSCSPTPSELMILLQLPANCRVLPAGVAKSRGRVGRGLDGPGDLRGGCGRARRSP